MANDPFEGLPQKDPKLDLLLKEVAMLGPWDVLERVFRQLDEFAISQLIEATTDDERRNCQAIVVVAAGLRQRLTRHRSQVNASELKFGASGG